MRRTTLDHHPAFRAVIAAAPFIFELARAAADDALFGHLALAAGELVSGFRAPVGTPQRAGAHHRAWVTVREMDRLIRAHRVNRRAPRVILERAQRAVDRADVMIGALPGVISAA
jgi:ribosomal protein L39E